MRERTREKGEGGMDGEREEDREYCIFQCPLKEFMLNLGQIYAYNVWIHKIKIDLRKLVTAQGGARIFGRGGGK